MTAIPELRTERLLLRPFQPEDVADALAYRNDAEFARFLPHIPQPFTRQDAETMVWVNMTESPKCSVTFAVVLGSTVIGTTNIERGADEGNAMLGYAIGRKWWGKGIATEAARAAAAWASAEFRLTRLWASTDVHNLQSQRVLQKLGMQRESIRVAHHVGRDGEPVDEVVYQLSIGALISSPASQDPVGISS